jgi:hypothetical protein
MMFELPVICNVVETGCARRHMYEMQSPSPLLAKDFAWIIVATLPGTRTMYHRNVVNQFELWHNMKGSATRSTPLTPDLMQTCARMPITGFAPSSDRHANTCFQYGFAPNAFTNMVVHSGAYLCQKSAYVFDNIATSMGHNILIAASMHMVLDCLTMNFVDSCLIQLFLCLSATSGAAAPLMYIFGYTGEPIVEDNLHRRWFWNALAPPGVQALIHDLKRLQHEPPHQSAVNPTRGGFRVVVVTNIFPRVIVSLSLLIDWYELGFNAPAVWGSVTTSVSMIASHTPPRFNYELIVVFVVPHLCINRIVRLDEVSCQKSAYVFVDMLQSYRFRPPALHNSKGMMPNLHFIMIQKGQGDSAEPQMTKNINCPCHCACLAALLPACLPFCCSAHLLACFAACLPACPLACFTARSCSLLRGCEHYVLLILLILFVVEGYSPMMNLASSPPMHFPDVDSHVDVRKQGGAHNPAHPNGRSPYVHEVEENDCTRTVLIGPRSSEARPTYYRWLEGLVPQGPRERCSQDIVLECYTSRGRRCDVVAVVVGHAEGESTPTAVLASECPLVVFWTPPHVPGIDYMCYYTCLVATFLSGQSVQFCTAMRHIILRWSYFRFYRPMALLLCVVGSLAMVGQPGLVLPHFVCHSARSAGNLDSSTLLIHVTMNVLENTLDMNIMILGCPQRTHVKGHCPSDLAFMLLRPKEGELQRSGTHRDSDPCGLRPIHWHAHVPVTRMVDKRLSVIISTGFTPRPLITAVILLDLIVLDFEFSAGFYRSPAHILSRPALSSEFDHGRGRHRCIRRLPRGGISTCSCVSICYCKECIIGKTCCHCYLPGGTRKLSFLICLSFVPISPNNNNTCTDIEHFMTFMSCIISFVYNQVMLHAELSLYCVGHLAYWLGLPIDYITSLGIGGALHSAVNPTRRAPPTGQVPVLTTWIYADAAKSRTPGVAATLMIIFGHPGEPTAEVNSDVAAAWIYRDCRGRDIVVYKSIVPSRVVNPSNSGHFNIISSWTVDPMNIIGLFIVVCC